MRENESDAQEMRALAGELLRAQRHNDQAAFIRAMARSEGRVPELLISLTFVANRAMDMALDPSTADSVVARIAAELTPASRRHEVARGVWLDAVALMAAIAADDDQTAQSIIRNVADLPMLFGMVLHSLSLLLPSVPAGELDRFLRRLRDVQTPPFS